MCANREDELKFYLQVLVLFDGLGEQKDFVESYNSAVQQLRELLDSPDLKECNQKLATQLLADFRTSRTPESL